MNISSIVIQTKPSYVKEVVEVCQKSDFCDYHFCDEEKGKIVVTIEGENIDEIAIDIIKQEFDDDIFGLYGKDYEPPHPDWATNFPEYADHAWRFVTVFTPISPEIK